MLSNSRGLRSGLLILAALVAWSAVGAVGGPAQGRLASVQTNDAAAFLPSDAESTRAAAAAAGFDDGESLPALVVVEAGGGGALDAEAQRAVQAFAAGLADAPLEDTGDGGPATVGELLVADPVAVPAEDGQAALVVVPLDADRSSERVGPEEERLGSLAVAALRELAAAPAEDGGLAGTGAQAWVSGPAGFVADLSSAFGGIDTLLLLVALGAVLVILALVYRSPVLPFLVILTAVLALALAGLVVYLLADAGVLVLNGQSQGILSILVVGAAVDYSLLVVARYREELRHVPDPRTAVGRAWRASVEPIVASAATVAAGLLCLLLSDLASNRSLGPVAAIGIAAALLAALTLLPALLVIAGRRSRALFWPRMPRYVAPAGDPGGAAAAGAVDEVEGHRLWSRVARTVGRRDRVVWVACTVALAAAAAFVPTFDAEGTSEADVFLGQVDSVDGEEALQRHFAGVSAQPAVVVVPEGDLDAVVAAAEGTDGVSAVVPVGEEPAAAPGAPAAGPPRVVDGTVRVDVTTTAPSDSQEAVRTVEALREAVHAAAPDALVGGAAAERLDTQLAGQRDLRVIVPAVLVVVLLILVALLRSVVAAVLLVAANVLSFGATLGVAALVFDHVLGFPGADPAVPLYGFCFLVALGVDYSIFLMSRVREEAGVAGPRPGVLRGLAITGSVITSAGVVLAATFAALGVIPLLFLAQLAFIVAFGVLLDTLVVRSLLVPALAHDLGRATWWPGRLARRAGVTA
jgi:RND superfamily putative drug exporter